MKEEKDKLVFLGRIIEKKYLGVTQSKERDMYVYSYKGSELSFSSTYKKITTPKVFVSCVYEGNRPPRIDPLPPKRGGLEVFIKNLRRLGKSFPIKHYIPFLLKLHEGKVINKTFSRPNRENPNHLVFLAVSGSVVFPLKASPNVEFLEKGKKCIYPVHSFLVVDKWISKMGVYVPVEFDFPLKYEASLDEELKVGGFEALKGSSLYKKDRVLIYIHGFVEPEKWHFVALCHFRKNCEIDVSKLPKECRRNLQERLEKEKQGKANEKSNCEVNRCLKERAFKGAHPLLSRCCEKIQKEAVTFWESVETKKLGIQTYHEKLWGKGVVKVGVIANGTIDGVMKRLVLRGICYNWDSDKPELHLAFVTYYPTDKIDLSLISKGKEKFIPEREFYLRELKRL